MDERKVEYLKRKIANKEADLKKYELVDDLIGRFGSLRAKTIFESNGKRIVQDKNGDKYFIDFKLFPLDEYGLSGYGRFTWGDINIEKLEDIPADIVKKMVEDSDVERFVYPDRDTVSQSLSYVQEKKLSRSDINTKQKEYEGISKDFYKKANRIYIANTANSRVALYENEGKYYVSERRRLITADGYDVILADQYSKKDELFEEVTEDEIKEIFGEDSLAKLNYGQNLDIAVLNSEEQIRLINAYYHNQGHTAEGLKEMQQDVKKLPEKKTEKRNYLKRKQKKEISSDEIAKLSKEKQMTTSAVHKNIFTRLLEKAKEFFEGRI